VPLSINPSRQLGRIGLPLAGLVVLIAAASVFFVGITMSSAAPANPVALGLSALQRDSGYLCGSDFHVSIGLPRDMDQLAAKPGWIVEGRTFAGDGAALSSAAHASGSWTNGDVAVVNYVKDGVYFSDEYARRDYSGKPVYILQVSRRAHPCG
jgi:hypothetical protein